MLLANFVNVYVRRVPRLLAHNQGNSLRLFDFPAPVFQFLIGVSLVLFLQRRGAGGLGARGTQAAAVRRFALLIVLGVVLDCIGTLQLWPQWGVLQTLGLGGLVATGFAHASDGLVAAVALGLLGLFSGFANGEVHHNPLAALAFVPLTLGGMIVGRGIGSAGVSGPFLRRSAAVMLASVAIAAVAAGAGVPFNKVLGTSSFVALTSAVSALLLAGAALLERSQVRLPRDLLAIGSNALTAWVLQYVLVYYPAWLVFPAWHRLGIVPGTVAAVATVGALSALTIALGRRGFRVPL